MTQYSNKDLVARSAFDEYVAGLDLPQYAVPFESSSSFPMIRYAKGVTVLEARRNVKYTGWHIAVEQSAELDSLFEEMGVPCVRVRHHKGSEEYYWQLDSIKGYLLCKSVLDEYGPDAWKKTGVPHVWNEQRGTYAYGSQLQCLIFLNGLLNLGYTQPLVLSFSRTITEHFIRGVLRRQEALLEAVKRALRKHDKHDNLASYAYWVELLKGDEEVSTKGGGSYFPPATTIELTADYVRSHQALPAHLSIIEDFLPRWDAWAASASKALLEPPRDNERVEAEPPENGNGAAKQAEEPEQAVAEQTEEEIDTTIKAANPALYKAALRAKLRAIDAKLVTNEEDWQGVLRYIKIQEFTTGPDIAKLNSAIDELIEVAGLAS